MFAKIQIGESDLQLSGTIQNAVLTNDKKEAVFFKDGIGMSYYVTNFEIIEEYDPTVIDPDYKVTQTDSIMSLNPKRVILEF